MNNTEKHFDYVAGQLTSGMQIPVLDKGFIRLIDKMGDDAAIVQAARVSYGKGTKTPSEDQALINYLMRNRHTTPLEMCELKFHIKMPIFIARQWVRHRTASINEYSCRYSEVPDDVYIPDPERIQEQSNCNKQGSGAQMIGKAADGFLNLCSSVQSIVSQAIQFGEKYKIARELNRINMTVAHYTEWYWKIDLHNLFHFLGLRLDKHAQWEIRQYAEVIAAIVAELYPQAWSAFVNYRLHAVTFSLPEQGYLLNSSNTLNQLQIAVSTDTLEKPDGFSETEWKEFCGKLRDFWQPL